MKESLANSTQSDAATKPMPLSFAMVLIAGGLFIIALPAIFIVGGLCLAGAPLWAAIIAYFVFIK